MRGITLLVALVALFSWAIGNLAYAQQDSAAVRLIGEDVRIPVSNGNYSIAARILRPDGAGPYGAIILNHGAAVSAEDRRTESPDLLIHTAAHFARRGYVVVLPLRRGFGATGGEFAEPRLVHVGAEPEAIRILRENVQQPVVHPRVAVDVVRVVETSHGMRAVRLHDGIFKSLHVVANVGRLLCGNRGRGSRHLFRIAVI